MESIRSITVCVEYDDFLAITLPRNKKHFNETLVITSYDDLRTQKLCKKEGVSYYCTNSFYSQGAMFNKGAAMEEGFDVLGRDGWICIWDADIVMPSILSLPQLNISYLYSPCRLILENPSQFSDKLDWSKLSSPTQSHEFDGFFQLFNSYAPISKPWYSTHWKHAGGCDSDFQFKFKGRLKRLPFSVLHLGPEGSDELKTRIGRNWAGRVSKRIDNGKSPSKLAEREAFMGEVIRNRKIYGTKYEHT
jgi:hypothetical protein